jgi:hypothetical protein
LTLSGPINVIALTPLAFSVVWNPAAVHAITPAIVLLLQLTLTLLTSMINNADAFALVLYAPSSKATKRIGSSRFTEASKRLRLFDLQKLDLLMLGKHDANRFGGI